MPAFFHVHNVNEPASARACETGRVLACARVIPALDDLSAAVGEALVIGRAALQLADGLGMLLRIEQHAIVRAALACLAVIGRGRARQAGGELIAARKLRRGRLLRAGLADAGAAGLPGDLAGGQALPASLAGGTS